MVLSTLLISWAVAAHEPELEVRPAPVSSSEAKVPRALIERIEKDYRRELKRPGEESVKHSLLHVSVALQSEKAGVLEENARFQMAPGGGTFDLSSLVTGKPGGFNLKFAVSDEAGATVTPSRIYFVPHARERTLEGERFGDGCGKFMDLTASFRKRFGAKGFDLFTPKQRYLSTVGGTFLITAFDQKTLQVAHVTFTDSRYPQLLCE